MYSKRERGKREEREDEQEGRGTRSVTAALGWRSHLGRAPCADGLDDTAGICAAVLMHIW